LKRRDFLLSSGSAATALLFSADSLQSPALDLIQNTNMDFKLKLLATKWGFVGTMDEFCSKVKKEGYDGMEIWWPIEQKEQDEVFQALKKYELEVGFLTAGHETNFNDNFASFRKMIDAAAANKVQKPLYINCHSGKDYFSSDQGRQIIEHTIALSKSTGIKICHETHRSRLLYSAPIARQYMESIPGLRITLDVSHWCNVHESLLNDQPEVLALAIQRADHIHARVGHPEGPQVNDPRAPEWEAAVKAHLGWWDQIVALKKQKGETLTILTEFGPPDYMPTLPYTRRPLADQWAINVYMMQLLRQRYQTK
jgi:sugar phosphate isomerase/epimerase